MKIQKFTPPPHKTCKERTPNSEENIHGEVTGWGKIVVTNLFIWPIAGNILPTQTEIDI